MPGFLTRTRFSRHGATSPAALIALLAAGSFAIALPLQEERARDAADDALALSAQQVVTSQRAYAARTGDFFTTHRWLAEGQHDALVLPLASTHRVLTYYSRGQRGLVVIVGDVDAQRTCSAVVRVHASDRPTRLSCDDDAVPQ